jgi:hypothetical protein
MVTGGCTSAYTVWLRMKDESKVSLSYKNVGKRVVRLAKHGILEEIKLEGVENLHGRKDYKVTMRGIEQLIPYIMTHPEQVQNMVKYIDKFNLDKNFFEDILVDKLETNLLSITEFKKHAHNPTIAKVAYAEFNERINEVRKTPPLSIQESKLMLDALIRQGKLKSSDFSKLLLDIYEQTVDSQLHLKEINDLLLQRKEKSDLTDTQKIINELVPITNETESILKSMDKAIQKDISVSKSSQVKKKPA